MCGKNAPSLFSPAADTILSRMRQLVDRPFRPLKFSFPAALLLSLVWNLVLLGFFHYSYRLDSHLSQKTRAALKRTREVIAKTVQTRPGIKRLLPTPDREKLADVLARGFQGSGKDIKAQIEALIGFLETLTESDSGNDPTKPEENLTLQEMLEILGRQGTIELDSGGMLFTEPSGDDENPLMFHSLPKTKRDRIAALRRNENRERERASIFRDSVRIKTAAGIKDIPLEYYFREPPYEQILAQGASMFYIIQGFPDFEPPKLPPIDLMPTESDRFNLILIRDLVPAPEKYPATSTNEAIFQAPEERIREILDGLMHFPEDRQLSFFAERYLAAFDPNRGDLPYLTRELIRNNLCSIVINYSRLSGAFGFIEQIFFSRPLDLTFHGYCLANPETRTGAEFLFALASHYNFEKRAIQYLYNAYPEARMVLRQPFPEPDLFNKKLKAYIIKEIHEELTTSLRGSGIPTLEDVLAEYSLAEKRIYDRIIGADGPDKNRGLYAQGSLYWEDKIYDQAVEVWNRIDSSFSFETFRKIKSVLTRAESQKQKIAQINDILEWDAHKGSEDLLKRLLKYKRWENRRRQKRPTI